MPEENQVDEESKKLLEDLEKQDKTPAPKSEKKAAPKKKAASKKAAPQPAPVAEKSDNNTVTNIGKNPRRIGGTVVAVGESYTLTEQDLDNETLLLKIDHAIRLGVLSHGAD